MRGLVVALLSISLILVPAAPVAASTPVPALGSATVVGDFNGDGRDDLATFDLGVWRVSLSQGAGFTTSTWATWGTATAWGPHRVGDFNGDGRDDVASYYSPTGRWWVNTSTGSSFTSALWAVFPTAGGWASQLVGDFTGDGRDDVANFHPSNATWWVSVSTGTGFVTPQWADYHPEPGWDLELVGDFTGDGRTDVLNHYAPADSWWVGVSTGSGFYPVEVDLAAAPTFAADFNGDGIDDLAAYVGDDWLVGLAPTFAMTEWRTLRPAEGWTQRVGDFDGDGMADIASFHSSNGTWWINRSTGAGFSTWLWTDFVTNSGWAPQLVGDFTGDRRADIINYAPAHASFWMSESTGLAFETRQWFDDAVIGRSCLLSGADAPTGSLVTVPGSAPPSNSAPTVKRFRVEVEAGLAVDTDCFGDVVQTTLYDLRSWAGEGDFAVQRVDSGSVDFIVSLASPATVDAYCYPVITGGIFSCWNGSRAMINSWRWEFAAASYGTDYPTYRLYVINHEVGHGLGHGHEVCTGAGDPAPVMMQQTKFIAPCVKNGWPLWWER